MKKSVPLVLQMENTECGAASLAMILKYYGKNIPLEQLRIDCGVSRNGINAKGISVAAAKYGLKCRAFKAEIGGLKKLPLPVIIHWDMEHFVVLRGINKDEYLINDPAIGKIKVYEKELNKRFTGIVLAFEKTEDFVPQKDSTGKGFTLRCIRECSLSIGLISLTFAFVALCDMIFGLFHSVYIDDVILDGNDSNFFVFALTVLAVCFVSLLGGIIAQWFNNEEEKIINSLISVGFMEKIFKLPMDFFYQRTAGELTNRQIGSFNIARVVCTYITPVLFQVLTACIYLVIVFMFNIYVAIVGVFAVLLNIAVSVYTSERINGVTAVTEKNKGVYNSCVSSSVEMIETIKSCACEDGMFAVITGTAALAADTRTKSDKISVVSNSVFYAINLAVSAAILMVGVGEILKGEFSIGGAIGAMGLTVSFFTPIGQFISSFPVVSVLKSVADRTDDTMNYKDDDTFLPDDGEQTKMTDGSVSVENVCFSYVPGVYAVKDLNFRLEKGKSIAFTGGSGSGKSTAAKLIAGLYCESSGKIKYGDAEKKELKRDYFYLKTAVVSQNVKLYDGTIFDNIAMWDDTISYDDVVAACKTACIHEDITSRRDAYYERIVEGGKNFSGGQRQRFEIARAVLKKPDVLILDEATSSLDVSTERKIMKNIRAMGITLIIIAHRLSTVKFCDEILVFDNGEVKERGTYDELFEKKGIFYKLAKGTGD
ncbi:MAG: ATP-binding cassette domain-containing protein [Firmicutes bacterium]|nr:ATP-binding cassette domain-containing protein [Bacillota bacterium]